MCRTCWSPELICHTREFSLLRFEMCFRGRRSQPDYAICFGLTGVGAPIHPLGSNPPLPVFWGGSYDRPKTPGGGVLGLGNKCSGRLKTPPPVRGPEMNVLGLAEHFCQFPSSACLQPPSARTSAKPVVLQNCQYPSLNP